MKTKASFAASLSLLILAGCGGGGLSKVHIGTTGGGGGGGTTGNTVVGQSIPKATLFHVDVKTGQVTIAGPGALGGRKAPTIFGGNSIQFNSSVLTSSSLGVKWLNVSLVNNSGFPLGGLNGVNVVFGKFANTSSIPYLKSSVNVSTLSGSTAGFLNGPLSVAKFGGIEGVAVGPDGTVYVADTSNERIRQIKNGFVSTFAGSGAVAETNGSGTTAAFDGPVGVAFNPVNSHLEVTDLLGNTIRDIAPNGAVTTLAGTGTAGEANGAAASATFSNPNGIAVDSKGVVYVSESSNFIRKISGGTVSTLAGNGTAGFVDGPGASAEFNGPAGLATDNAGNLFVADRSNNRIRMIDSSGNVTTVAGTGTSADVDGYGDNAALKGPDGIAFLNGSLIVMENQGDMARVVQHIPGAAMTASGWFVDSLAGTGVTGGTNGTGATATFANPLMIAVSSSGNIYVADTGNARVRLITAPNGTFPVGTPGSSASEAPQLSNATTVEDNSDLGPAAPVIHYAGPIAAGAASQAQAWNFTIDPKVTAFNFQVLVESDPGGTLPLPVSFGAGSPQIDVRTYLGNATKSVGFFVDAGFLNGNATEAKLNEPIFVAADSAGILYIADFSNNMVRRCDANGNVTTIAGAPGLSGNVDGTGDVARFFSPCGIAVGVNPNEIFVADSTDFEIRRIVFTGGDITNPANWLVTTIAGSTTTGNTHKDGTGNIAGFSQINSVCSSQSGNLYVSESAFIRRITFQGGDPSVAANYMVTTVAGNGTAAFRDGYGTGSQVDNVSQMACDRSGNLFFTDEFNYRIRKLDVTGNVTTVAGTGGLGHQDGAGSSATFNDPAGIAVDSAGYIYVADANNDLVRRIAPSGYVETIAGQGAVQGSADGVGYAASFDVPVSLALSPTGDLYVGSYDPTVRLIQAVVSSAAGPVRRR